MPLRKIRDLKPEEVCPHPDHKFPSHIVLEDGVWEHTCPACGHRTVVTIRNARYVGAPRFEAVHREKPPDPRHCGWKDPHAIG